MLHLSLYFHPTQYKNFQQHDLKAMDHRDVNDVPNSFAGIVCINIAWVSVLYSCAWMGWMKGYEIKRKLFIFKYQGYKLFYI